MSNTVNYYSSEEEVLKCGDGETRFPVQRTYAWYNQERYKGTKDLLQSVLGFGRNEGGWAFNDAYKIPVPEYDETTHGFITRIRPRTPAEVAEADYSEDRLKEATFFGPFADASICSSNQMPTISEPLRAQLLADAIPAESLVAGFTAVPAWNTSVCRNFNMASDEFKDAIMKTVLSKQDWVHSFFIQAPYSVVHQLYEDIVQKTK